MFTDQQLDIIQKPLTSRIFLRGPAGTGKTSTAVERLSFLLQNGISGDSIFLLTPHRNLALPFIDALNKNIFVPGGQVHTATMGGLAKRMVDLFWPHIASVAGFSQPNRPPTFLTLETTQYFIAKLVRPLLDNGFFNSITIERNRLYSQIIDNLNKAAVVGFPHTEISSRLKSAWNGEPGMLRVFEDAQYCANLFRDYCLQHNLLDYSLQMEIFIRYIWESRLGKDYLVSKYRHLVIDNVEEDPSIAHDLLIEWMDECASALVVYDDDAGYRRFLGADPESALRLGSLCDLQYEFANTFVMSQDIESLANVLGDKIRIQNFRQAEKINISQEHIPVEFAAHRFFPEMLDWVAQKVASLIRDHNTPPGEIVIISPFLSDALRFSILTRLNLDSIPVRSHRPSRALRDEPVTQALLTFALLAHPEWIKSEPMFMPNRFEVSYALMQAIGDLDPIRAQLLTSIVFREREPAPNLTSFERIKADMQERITYRIGEKYETLRKWLLEYQKNPVSELDYFISRLFGELLSQTGFGFHRNFQAGEITANLIESIQKFRWVTQNAPSTEKPFGLEYIEMIREGVIAAQYLRSWESWSENSVLIAPAYTFLMYNQPVDYQFWLDPGSHGWSERLYQPLTHPYVLSRGWNPDRIWTDLDEVEINEQNLYRLTKGLLYRCRKKIYLGLSDINEQGYEQRGPLLHAFQRVFQA